MRRLTHWMFAGVFTLGAAIAIAAASPAHIVVPGRGDMVLAVPAGWAQTRGPGTENGPPTLSLKESSGRTFHVDLTVLGRNADGTRNDPTRIRAFVGEAAKAAESQSVEKHLAIRDLPGANGRGFYFLATDRAPAPGEWKYLTQGAVGVGNVLLVFTILTNDGQDEIAAAALQMVRQATFEGPATST